jgi:hypothetical protein
MAAGIPTRLTASQGRKFGLTVGVAFLVLAAFVWWRGHLTVAAVFAALGGMLSLAGLVIPTHLGPVERAWMALAHAISKVTTPIVMSVIYFVVVTPTALLRRSLGGNPLVHSARQSGFWHERPAHARRSNSMERQF